VLIGSKTGYLAPRRSLLLVHPDGSGSKVSNEEMNVSLEPASDFGGIAKAAAGGHLFAARVEKASELDEVLKEAISAVHGGRSAVVDCKVVPGS
jgi:hypothetical protein